MDKEKIKEWNEKVEGWVFERFKKEEWPSWEKKEEVEGEVVVRAHPILGIEKYLGMWDGSRRLAYFPSLKLTNDSYATYMYARFDASLKEDVVVFGDKVAEGKELKRFMKIIGKFRELTGVKTPVKIISKHVPKIGKVRGKGLGLSASASGAAASALLLAAGYRELYENNRFLSVLARYLSGSGTSSAAGGFSVWFSYEGIKDEDSYAVCVSKGDWLDLVVVPIPYEGFKTESAHKAAVASPYYKEWAELKGEWVYDLLDAIEKKDVERVGKHAEKDAYWLSMLMATGGDYINWMPQTTGVAREVVNIRREHGIKAYYTMDTGPSVAVIVEKGKGKEVMEMLKEKFGDLTIYGAEARGKPVELKGEEREKALEILNVEKW